MQKQIFKLVITALALGLMSGCASSGSSSNENQYRTDSDRPLVDGKYSLAADRKAMEEARAQVPESRKKENDELALILGLMSEVKKTPSEIRNQFDSIVRKRREAFNRDMKKERETFTKEERQRRDEFLKNQKRQKDGMQAQKPTREQRTEMMRELDGKRQEFFSDERDKRNDFESDFRERRKSFEDYVKEKQNEFNGELRSYQKRYDEMKKQKAEQTKSQQSSLRSDAAALDAELDAISKKPGTPLEAGE